MIIGSSAVKFFRNNKRRLLLGMTLIFAIWVASAFVHVWYRQKIFIVGQQIRVLEKEIVELQRKESVLRIKIAKLHDPELLKRYASNLQEPQRDRICHVAMYELRMDRRRVAQELATGRKRPEGHILSQRINSGKSITTN
ncbi:MAG: hypothetical protein LBF26_01820 [Puniceicoccales bacterium]|jgi:hypothetical protein|nr:hypothetical protein [Puniceicoccales bacterium]